MEPLHVSGRFQILDYVTKNITLKHMKSDKVYTVRVGVPDLRLLLTGAVTMGYIETGIVRTPSGTWFLTSTQYEQQSGHPENITPNRASQTLHAMETILRHENCEIYAHTVIPVSKPDEPWAELFLRSEEENKDIELGECFPFN